MIRRLLLLVGGFLAIAPSRASDTLPSAGQIAEAILRIWVPYVYEYYESFKQYMITTQEVTTDQKNVAFAKFGDAITSNMRDLYRQEQTRAAAPPPQSCRNRGIARAGGKAMTRDAVTTRTNTLGGDADASLVTATERARRRRLRAAEAPKGPDDDHTPLMASGLTLPGSTPDDYDPYRFARHLMGDTELLATRLPPALEGRRNAVAYEDLRAAHLSRISIARRALQRTITIRKPSQELLAEAIESADADDKAALQNRAVKNGISSYDLLVLEIEQTYGSPRFRNELEQLADPTPAFKTVAALLATRSRLLSLVEQFSEDRNLLLSALATCRLDRNELRERLDKAYLISAGDSRTLSS